MFLGVHFFKDSYFYQCIMHGLFHVKSPGLIYAAMGQLMNGLHAF